MTDIKTKAQAVMEQFLWEPKFSKRDEKLALVRALKEVIKQFGYTHLYVDVELDGYDTEEEMNAACEEFIHEQLNFSASSVKIERIEND